MARTPRCISSGSSLKPGRCPGEGEAETGGRARDGVIAWIGAVRSLKRRGTRATPAVLARRLSNAEYDHTIRDLTGVDLRPTKEFPVDPANGPGSTTRPIARDVAGQRGSTQAAAGRRPPRAEAGRTGLRRIRCSPTPTATSTA
ncbi:MAG: DUF1587 domain-containing protein [Singulisphaera sp.]